MFNTPEMLIEQHTNHNTTNTPITSRGLQFVTACQSDCDSVIRLFGALHTYNASLDHHFALSDNWEDLLHQEFHATYANADKLWLLVKTDNEAVGLLIASVHTDSAMFRYRQWVEVEALYVADSHRRMGIAGRLLDAVYDWAVSKNLPRVQLYVTATNVRAQHVYEQEGFITAQAIMRKKLAAS